MMFYVEIALKDLSIFPPSDKEYFHPLFSESKSWSYLAKTSW